MIRLNPFPILLNNLSNELDDRNIQSLIHVCGEYIPGGQRERIRSGWDVFNILLRQNVIGSEPEKMANLLLIFKELRPRRRDLIHRIKQHIREHCEQPDKILNLDSLSPAVSLTKTASSFDLQRSSPQCCSLHCCCFSCSCNRCNPPCGLLCCCVILAVLFTFFAVVASLAWYAHVPEVTPYLHSNNDLHMAGPYVIGLLGGFALTALSVFICIRCARIWQKDNPTYTVIPSKHNGGNIQSRCGAVQHDRCCGTTRSAPESHQRPHHGPPDSPITCTPASSLVSECETAPDGLQQDNFTEIFPQEMDEDERFFTPE